MTTPAKASSTDVAVPDEAIEGLEDYDVSTDGSMPLLKLVSKEGYFQDTLSGETYPELFGVAAGYVKQRILWDPELEEENPVPWCKAPAFTVGIPDVHKFPWKAAGLSKPALDEDDEPVNGQPTIVCDECPLKEWDSHPSKSSPWCSVQHSYIFFLPNEDTGVWMPNVLTFQRTAIKPSNTYVTSFVRDHMPMYKVFTKITLDERKKGTNIYHVPIFQRGEATNADDHEFFLQGFRTLRNFLHNTARLDAELSEEDREPDAEPVDPPKAAPAAKKAAPKKAAGATKKAAPKSDLPF